MICPKCNNKIDYGLSTCPHCNHNLSFSTKIRTEEDRQQIEEMEKAAETLKKGWIIGGVITMFVLLLMFNGLSFLGAFYFNGVMRIIDIVLKTMLGIGIVGFIICLILFIKKKRTKIMKIFWIISLILIVVPMFSKSIVQINGDISLKDYSKVEYIELGAEKIPSVYSVVGKRKIVMSHNEEDTTDEGLNITIDMVAIIYSDLTAEDIEKYKEALIDYGFVEETIYNTDENEYQKLLLKNNIKDNSFYVIGIDGLSVLYSTSSGTYQEALHLN